jgi:hypothetical protein
MGVPVYWRILFSQFSIQFAAALDGLAWLEVVQLEQLADLDFADPALSCRIGKAAGSIPGLPPGISSG